MMFEIKRELLGRLSISDDKILLNNIDVKLT